MTASELLGAPVVHSFSGCHPYRPECVVASTELYWLDHLPDHMVTTVAVHYTNRVTVALAEGQCPRCHDPLDPKVTAGSRFTSCRCIPICPACEEDEANQMMLGQGGSPVGQWPISKGWRTRRTNMIAKMFRPSEGFLSLSEGVVVTDDGVSTVTQRPNPGGWAEFGYLPEPEVD